MTTRDLAVFIVETLFMLGACFVLGFGIGVLVGRSWRKP